MKRTSSVGLLCVVLAIAPAPADALEVYFDVAADAALNASQDSANRWHDVVLMEASSIVARSWSSVTWTQCLQLGSPPPTMWAQ